MIVVQRQQTVVDRAQTLVTIVIDMALSDRVESDTRFDTPKIRRRKLLERGRICRFVLPRARRRPFRRRRTGTQTRSRGELERRRGGRGSPIKKDPVGFSGETRRQEEPRPSTAGSTGAKCLSHHTVPCSSISRA